MLEPLFECKFTPTLESPEPPKAEPVRNLKVTITIDGVETEITPEQRDMMRHDCATRLDVPDEMDDIPDEIKKFANDLLEKADHELKNQLKDKERINNLCSNSLIKSFDKMVEKYNLKHFVKQVEETGGNPFIAIIPFITDHEDLSNYHQDLVCCPL